MLHALHLFDCCAKQNRRGSFRDKLRQPVQTDDDVSLACFSCLWALPTERPSILTPWHSAHHWPGVRQMVQCLLRSELRASQKLGAWGQPTAYAQWMTMTRCANVSIGLQRKGWRETIAIRVALVHTGHSQGRPFPISWVLGCSHRPQTQAPNQPSFAQPTRYHLVILCSYGKSFLTEEYSYNKYG